MSQGECWAGVALGKIFTGATDGTLIITAVMGIS